MVQVGAIAEEQPDQQAHTQQYGGEAQNEFERGANVNGGNSRRGGSSHKGLEVRRNPLRRRPEKPGKLLGDGCNIHSKVLSMGREKDQLTIDNEQLTIMVSLRDD